jgi:cysteine-rich repeat protein
MQLAMGVRGEDRRESAARSSGGNMKRMLIPILSVFFAAGAAVAGESVRYDDGPLDFGPSSFEPDGRRWPSPMNLDYSFFRFTGDLAQVEVETAIANAFSLWASACPNLVFSKIGDNLAPFGDAGAVPPNAGQLRIGFEAGSHGDPAVFDGAGGVLAHAFFPPPNLSSGAGDVHFDDDETWALVGAPGGGSPRDLTTVAAHEIGHALGLKHENDVDAIMNANYTGPRGLSQDDIDGIRALYCPSQIGSRRPVDLLFLLDITGSMGDDLPLVQASIPVILQAIVTAIPNTRIGLATFQDFPQSPYGDSGDSPFTLQLPLGTPTNVIQTAVQALVASGGNDGPEAQYPALLQATSSAGFARGRLPVIVLLTDADFHNSDVEPGYPGAGRTQVLAALATAGVKVFTMIAASPPDLSGQQKGAAGDDPAASFASLEAEAEELASLTGGGVFRVGSSSALFGAAVTTAVSQLAEEGACGNGVREGIEVCDGADAELCPGACLGDCTCPLDQCGNGILEGGEQCDGADDDACPGLCLGDCSCESIPVCGNGIREGAEECDGSDDAGCDGLCDIECSCGDTPLDHFFFYKTKKARGSAGFVSFGPITLADQLGIASYDVKSRSSLGLPADENSQGVADALGHLASYKVARTAGAPTFDAVSDVRIVNQCSDALVELKKPDTLLVPTNRDLSTPPLPPPVESHDPDHFLCYRSKLERTAPDGSKLPPFPKGTQVDVADAFQTRRYDLKKLTRVCLPVAKSGAPVQLSGPQKGQPFPITPSSIQNPADHLVCYQAALAKETIEQSGCGAVAPGTAGTSIVPTQPRHSPVTGFFIANQFGTAQLDSVKEVELCIPSARDPVCGDGILQSVAGEQCDDGDTDSGDGCSATCQAEFCGDGVLQPGLGEECEIGDPGTCTSVCSGACSCITEDLTTCSPRVTDLWEFPVTAGASVRVAADTADAATAADLCFSGSCGSTTFGADDNTPCTFPPPSYACPTSTLTAPADGVCTFNLTLCSSACRDPATANYLLDVQVSGAPVTPTLLQDDF